MGIVGDGKYLDDLFDGTHLDCGYPAAPGLGRILMAWRTKDSAIGKSKPKFQDVPGKIYRSYME